MTYASIATLLYDPPRCRLIDTSCPLIGHDMAQDRRILNASVLLSYSVGRLIVLGCRQHLSSSSFVVIISSSSLSTSSYCVASSCVRWSFRRRVSPSRVGRFPRPLVVFPPSRPSSSLSSSSVRCGRQSASVVVWTSLPACVRRRLRRRRPVVVAAVACCVVVVVVVVVLVVARRPRND